MPIFLSEITSVEPTAEGRAQAIIRDFGLMETSPLAQAIVELAKEREAAPAQEGSYHSRVMNLVAPLDPPITRTDPHIHYPLAAVRAGYDHGHRDARHAAAEIAAEADAEVKELKMDLTLARQERDNCSNTAIELLGASFCDTHGEKVKELSFPVFSAWVTEMGCLPCALAGLATALAKQEKLGVHLQHCNFGEHAGSCKYGNEDCPALTEEWDWFGWNLQQLKRCDDCHAMMNPIGKGIFECWKCGHEGQKVATLLEAQLRAAVERAAKQAADKFARQKAEYEAKLANTRALLEKQDARVNRLSERAETAEADAARLRGALHRIIKRTQDCTPLVAIDVREIAQAALRPGACGEGVGE